MNELTFLDLVILQKVDGESSVEKFGSMINTSFFETANLLGTVKIKGYIDIESSVGGLSGVAITDAGQSLLAFAEHKAAEPIEPLDDAILRALAGGAKDLDKIQSVLNVRGGDLAYHINKLVVQGFMDYSVKSASVSFVLTERGFNATGGVRASQTPAAESPPASAQTAWQPPAPKTHPLTGKPVLTGGEAPNAPQATPAEKGKGGPARQDIAHLLSDYDEEEPRPAAAAESGLLHAGHSKRVRAPQGAQALKTRRLFSKAGYYLKEYLPYILLVAVVFAIFLGAIILSLAKVI